MPTPWLTGVLTRGTPLDPGVPWRPAAAESWEVELRQGLVRHVVGDVLVAGDVGVDTPQDAAVRAGALALLLPADVVVLGAAALWVHLGHPLPAPTEVLVTGRRPTASVGGVVVRRSRARTHGADVVAVGPLRVSSPVRALLEAATTAPHRAPGWRAALARAGLLDAASIERASSAARGRTGVRVARRALSLPRSATPRALSPSAGARP
ncbi:hypothetical protein AB2L28_11855 [Kineococcus sp. TBRC 1896]|uniref:Transcriptional regulator with AbiEi antitoxin domain of type IV toxin-antitoxin system n=1 Tax=Kineococcus mangrovi TaxID=1660183 RepID=A0ABV4I6M1_9ACTN